MKNLVLHPCLIVLQENVAGDDNWFALGGVCCFYNGVIGREGQVLVVFERDVTEYQLRRPRKVRDLILST
jgi:hypothetical protein